MREIRVFFWSLLALGCAHSVASSEVPASTLLSPAQVRQAMQGTVSCVDYKEDGLCESIHFYNAISPHAVSVREVMLDDIQTLVAEPISRFVRQMPMYSQNADLFVALEAERSRGNFRYIKRVLSSRNELDSASNFWCWRSAADFEDMQFYFSNSTSADVENDQPIDPALARQLRLFLNAVLSDPIFREAVESTPEAISMLDLVQGRSKGCSEYYGSITDGRPDIRRLSISIEGVEVIGLRSEVRPFRIGQVPSLRAD